MNKTVNITATICYFDYFPQGFANLAQPYIIDVIKKHIASILGFDDPAIYYPAEGRSLA
jgi:hypothetical protein